MINRVGSEASWMDSPLLLEYMNTLGHKIDLQKKEKQAILDDFGAILDYYIKEGISSQEAIMRLGVDPLGDFYLNNKNDEWYHLDNAAKVYPLSMTHSAVKMYRVSAYLNEDVVPCVLQIAFLITIKRFPRFCTTIKRGLFWHYLDAVRTHYTVRKEHMMPCAPIDVSRSRSLTFRLQYFDKRISFEAFHVLSDGGGAMIFLKTLIAQYLKLLGKPIPPNPEIFDVDQTPTANEWSNDFFVADKAKTSRNLNEKIALHVRGKRSFVQPVKISHYMFSVNELRQIAKKRNTTISVLMLFAMLLSCRAAIKRKKGRINIDVPVNMRKFYHSSTLNNFSMYGVLSFQLENITDSPDMLTQIAEKLANETSKESMDRKILWINSFVNNPFVKYLPLFIKTLISRFSYILIGEETITATFSNLGAVKCDFANNVEQFDFMLGPTTVNIVGCAIGSYEDHMVLTITKATKEPSFELAMLDQLQRMGLNVNVEEVSV